ncbi:MucBP domain protein, partial [Enterococcus faecalis 06-MB-DW-09]
MFKKIGSSVVVMMLTINQPITIIADTIDSGIQSIEQESNNSSVDSDSSFSFNGTETTSERTIDSYAEESFSSEQADEHETSQSSDRSNPDSTSEGSAFSYSINSGADSSEDSKDSASIETNEEYFVEDVVTGIWGSVPWEWNPDTFTITLFGGEAGTPAIAPWRTYREVQQIIINEAVKLPTDVSHLFRISSASGLPDLKRIINAGNLDFSQVTNMSFLFSTCTSLYEVDMSTWNTSKVTNMQSVFHSTKFESLDLKNWNTSNVTNMSHMFRNTQALKQLDISSWNMSNVTTRTGMFIDASQLSTLTLGNNNQLRTTDLPNVPLNDSFAGVWIYDKDLAGNDQLDPPIYTSTELMSMVTPGQAIAGTYIWGKQAEAFIFYKDTEGNTLKSPDRITGIVKKAYTTSPIEINGYEISIIPDNASGAFTEEAQEVVYIYDRSDAAPVTVRY